MSVIYYVYSIIFQHLKFGPHLLCLSVNIYVRVLRLKYYIIGKLIQYLLRSEACELNCGCGRYLLLEILLIAILLVLFSIIFY